MEAAQRVKRGPITREKLLKLRAYFVSGIKYHATGRLYTPKPLHSTISTTHRCNSRCIMCSYWQEPTTNREFTPKEFSKIYRNPLFRSLESFSLGGGEPTLREDLVQIAQAILEACPQVKGMALLTNGLDSTLVLEQTEKLLALCQHNKVKFSVSISLDGYGATHEKIRRVPRAFERVSETLKRLQGLQQRIPFNISLNCVVQPVNVSNLGELSDFTEELGLPITYSPIRDSGVLGRDAAKYSQLKLNGDQVRELKTLVSHKLEARFGPSKVLFWREYFRIVGGGRRRLPCFLLYHSVILDTNGDLRICDEDGSFVYGNVRDEPPDRIWYSDRAKELRKKVARDSCPRCISCCRMASSLSLEFFCYARFLLQEKGKRLLRK